MDFKRPLLILNNVYLYDTHYTARVCHEDNLYLAIDFTRERDCYKNCYRVQGFTSEPLRDGSEWKACS